MRRVGAAAVLAAIGVASLIGGAPAASARTDPVAYLRGAHLSPDTPAVDVYLTAFRGGTTTLWLSSVGYGAVSPYRRIAAGEYAVSMRPHGASEATNPVLSWTIQLAAGHAYTALAIGHEAALRGTIIQDSLTAPPAGDGRVRVLQASSRAGRVTVSAGAGHVLTRHLAFGGITGYTTVPAGTWTVRATGTHASASARVTIASKSVLSVVVLDGRSGGIEVHTLVDAAGPAVPPSGPVPAGGGGMAARPAPHGGPVEYGLLAATGAVLVGFVGAVLRRRRVGEAA